MKTSEKAIFDREDITQQLTWLLEDNVKHRILVEGESGSGKSAAIEFTFHNIFNVTKEVLQFSFKIPEKTNIAHNLRSFISSNYLEQRKKNIKLIGTKSIPKISGASLSMAGPALSFGINDLEEQDLSPDFIFQYLRLCGENGVKVINISNVELIEDKRDIKTISNLLSIANPKIHILIENGTLTDTNLLTSQILKSYSVKKIFVPTFKGEQASAFYRYIHRDDSPEKIYEKTMGNAFSIIHYSEDTIPHDQYANALKKIQSLSSSCRETLCYISALGGEVCIDDLLSIMNKSLTIRQDITSLTIDNILIEKNNQLLYSHSFFQKPILTQESSKMINRFIRPSIVEWLRLQIDETKPGVYLAIASQYIELGHYNESISNSWKAFLTSYEQQKYSIALQAINLGLNTPNINSKASTIFTLAKIQIKALLGHANKNGLEYIKKINNINDINVRLLKAQLYYLCNRFELGLREIEEIISDVGRNQMDLAKAFAIGASINIATGKKQKAKDYFSSAKNHASLSRNHYFDMEILRMSPKIEGWDIGKVELNKIIKSKHSKNFPYSKAKALHNLGFSKIIQSRGESGLCELEEARYYFEKYEAPEITYSIVAHSVVFILKGEYEKAQNDLLDALNLSHEQYDRFAVLTNLGNVKLLLSDINAAIPFYDSALKTLEDAKKPLTDPVLNQKANHNLAVSNLIIGNYDEAEKYASRAEVPEIANFYKHRLERQKILVENIKMKKRDIDIRVSNPKNINAWPVTEFNISLAKLSFYDFNARIFETSKFSSLGKKFGLS